MPGCVCPDVLFLHRLFRFMPHTGRQIGVSLVRSDFGRAILFTRSLALFLLSTTDDTLRFLHFRQSVHVLIRNQEVVPWPGNCSRCPQYPNYLDHSKTHGMPFCRCTTSGQGSPGPFQADTDNLKTFIFYAILHIVPRSYRITMTTTTPFRSVCMQVCLCTPRLLVSS